MAWNSVCSGHLVAADLHLEIRGVGLAIDHDLVQRALVSPLRGEDAADALDGAQVGIVEGVGAAHSGRSRLVGVPGAEVAAALDLAHRFGIGQHGGKIHRLAGAYGAQGKALDDKMQGELARLVGAQGEHGVGAVHLVRQRCLRCCLVRWLVVQLG